MRKIIKRVLLVIAAIIILFLGVGLSYYYPMLLMPRVITAPVLNTNIVTLNAMGAVYLIKTDDGYIMIDAGLSVKSLQASLNEVSVNPDAVKWIFLTHSDGDHVGGLNLFPTAEIYMGEGEFPLINGTAKRSIFGGNRMPSGIDINKINLLHDGQELFFNGVTIQCAKAPGHTPGSMLYLVDSQFLFTGDVLKIKDGKSSVHPYTMDKALSKKTIEQLKEKMNNSLMVLTSHYGIITN